MLSCKVFVCTRARTREGLNASARVFELSRVRELGSEFILDCNVRIVVGAPSFFYLRLL